MINKMKKLSAVIYAPEADGLLRELLWLSCVEVAQTPDTGKELTPPDCADRRTRLEDELSSLEAAMKLLAPMREMKKKLTVERGELRKRDFGDGDAGVGRAVEAAREANGISSEAERLKAELNRTVLSITRLGDWSGYALPLDFGGTRTTGVIAGQVAVHTDISALDAELGELTDGSAYTETVFKNMSTAGLCVIYHRAYEREVMNALSKYGFIKNGFRTGNTAAEELKAENAKRESILRALDANKEALREKAKLIPEMEKAYDIKATELGELTAKEKLGCTKSAAVITGWVPEKQLGKVEKVLGKHTCSYELTDPSEDDDVPVQLSNNVIGDPFESLIALYSYPKYGTYDPTLITGLFYALFFGIMTADVGYGLLTIIGSLLLIKFKKPRRASKQMLMMFCYSGVASTVMGVLFNGYFGDLPVQLAEKFFGAENFGGFWYLLDPLKSATTFFIISLAAGAVHLLTGLVIKMCMLIKSGDILAAIFDIGSWFFIFGGIGLYFIAGTAGIIVALIGVAMIVVMKDRGNKNPITRFFKGLLGMYDLVSYMSDLLSYSRVMALCLSSAVIASVFNTLATLGGSSPASIILFPIIFIVGHALNLALGLLGSFIHSGRLQYVEFFGKFYEDGGRPFAPVAPELKYTDLAPDDGDIIKNT